MHTHSLYKQKPLLFSFFNLYFKIISSLKKSYKNYSKNYTEMFQTLVFYHLCILSLIIFVWAICEELVDLYILISLSPKYFFPSSHLLEKEKKFFYI